ncbi:transcription termination factor NusA [Megasphaera butyrica]|uniref:transcription termination factor NusA n=1 Tax=Megasphaera TaxID=906 RepID=UPI00082150B9|nr:MULTISPECIES: transcription termination factor NusA [Megasphaera]MDN0047626.1 transcription termination factor NusA [Megasphaera hexanoica]SCJ10761.1 Transcription elongation protein nusA [uncultured Ruminococcus sp.]MBM6732516.1 transcription termination/antitermination protein NusA [Megasphaera stantonii]MCU6714572.1 transcription termination factor NusA [Megasphaera butyrica]SCH63741.1 Transcription elongation protein nusA [uncultured Megasphaera sp.]
MNKELLNAIAFLSKEKGVSTDVICDSLEAVLITAYKKEPEANPLADVELNRETGDYRIVAAKTVVEDVVNDHGEISLADARKLNPEYEVGDVVNVDVTPSNFGRIAAQAAKQVMIQRLREAERSIVYDEFYNRTDDIITGLIQRIENKNVYVDLGKAEAILPASEQIPTETYTVGQRIKCYVVEVRKTTKGAQILVSRTHPGLLKRLFELEVPEIYEGVVELKSVAREPGRRSKIAVYSRDENVDSVGACVGPKGSRVQNIVTELQNEKIDIVKWDEDPAVYIANALSPAQVVSVTVDEGEKASSVVVPDYQLSLAIGKAGQNARLAAKLTNWKIDIKSESQAAALASEESSSADEEVEQEDILSELDMPAAEDGQGEA